MDPERIFRSLSESGVHYVLVGGLAAVAHGSSLGTFDVDICFRQEAANCRRLATALSALESEIYPTRPRIIPISADLLCSRSLLHLRTAAGRLDLVAEVPGLGPYDDLQADATVIEFAGIRVQALSLDQLIRSKVALDQPKDREQVDQLRELQRLRDEDGG